LLQSENLHLYGFSPVCVLKCVFKLKYNEKFFPHISHLWGFSPECTNECLLSFELSVNFLPQPSTGQINYLTPCVAMCFFNDE